MNENVSIEQLRRKHILALMPELERRYTALRALMVRAETGETINDSALLLAYGDLKSVIDVMVCVGEDDDE